MDSRTLPNARQPNQTGARRSSLETKKEPTWFPKPHDGIKMKLYHEGERRKMHINRERIGDNVRQAATEDLLDRATVYREGMEAEALDMIERELQQRGVSRDAIAEHERKRREEILFDSQGTALKCYRCRRPAVVETWGWHRLWGVLPLFPRYFAWCAEHKPRRAGTGTE
jgi:hypothetical protein